MAISSTKGPIQVKRGTAAQWAAAEAAGIILLDGELGYDDDADFFRVGDGATPWSQLKNLGAELIAQAQVLLTQATSILHQIVDASSVDDARIATLVRDASTQTTASFAATFAVSNQIVTPESFKLDSDGLDWAPAIMRALAQGVALGVPVVQSKSLEVRSTVTVPSGARWYGLRPDVTVSAPKGSPLRVVQVEGATDVVLARFTIDGGVTDQAPEVTNPRGVVFHNSTKLTLSNMTVQNCADWATSFELSNDIYVQNYRHPLGGGAYRGGRDGLHFLDCSDVLVDGAVIWSGDDCIGITSESRSISNITIRNVAGVSEIASIITIGNEGASAFTASDILIENVHSYNPTGSQRGQYLVKARAQNGSILQNLTVRNVSGTVSSNGVWVEASVANNARNITVENCSATSTAQYGLVLVNISNASVVGGNYRAISTDTHGVFLGSCRYVTLLGVRATESGGFGFQLNGCTDVTLTSCVARDNGGATFAAGNGGGLRIVNCTTVNVQGGSFTGAATTSYFGFSIDGSTGVFISNRTKFGGANNTNPTAYTDKISVSAHVGQSTPSEFTVANSDFRTLPIAIVDSDTASGWDSTNFWYTVPVSGDYQINASLRPNDGSVSGRGIGLGVHTGNTDGPWLYWYQGGANRTTLNYSRVAHFSRGDRVRAFAYFDTPAPVPCVSASIALVLVKLDA